MRFQRVFRACVLLASLIGCAQVQSYTSSVYFLASGTKEAKEKGVELKYYDYTYEPCASQVLWTPEIVEEWKRRMGDKEERKYVVGFYLDRIFVKHLEDFEFSNAELLVVSEVRDGIHDPVRTVVKYVEDAPIDNITLDQSNIEIYPPTPYEKNPYEVRVKVVELDEGQENEIKNALDLFDVIEKGAKALFSFALPGGVGDGLRALGEMDKSDVELDRTISRIVPTLSYQSEKDAQETRDKFQGGAWKDPKGKCYDQKTIGIEKLDLTPHKSIIVIKDLEKYVPEAKRANLRYLGGRLCYSEQLKDGQCEEYKLSTYVVVRMESYTTKHAETEKASEVLAKHNQEYVNRLKKIGLKEEESPDTLWDHQ